MTTTDAARVDAFLKKHSYLRRLDTDDLVPVMELADALESVPHGRIGSLMLFDVWMTCTDRANRDRTLSLSNAEVRDAAVRVANLPLDPARVGGVMVGQDPRTVARFMDRFNDHAVLSAYDPRHTNGWDRITRERALYVTTSWVDAGVPLDDAWTVAFALGDARTRDGYSDRVRDALLSHHFPVPLVHGIAMTDAPLSDVLDAMDTFRELNAKGGFPAALVCTALGVPDDAMGDDEWNAFCDRKRVETS